MESNIIISPCKQKQNPLAQHFTSLWFFSSQPHLSLNVFPENQCLYYVVYQFQLLGHAIQPVVDAEAFQLAWERVSAHFDTLLTTEHSVDELMETILQLAVMGKLVPQNPNDEPAGKLLEKITIKKESQIKEGHIKKFKTLPTITAEEIQFELPTGWEWTRLQDCIDVRDGTHASPKDASGKSTYPLITSKNFIDGEIDFNSARRISKADNIGISKRSRVEVDDVLFSVIGGNIGNQVMVKDALPLSIKNVALFKYYSEDYTVPKFFKK